MNGALRTLQRVFERHGDRPPYRELLRRFRGPHPTRFGVAICEPERPTPIDHYEIALERGKLSIVSHGIQPPVTHWVVSTEELRRLAEDPDGFLQDPDRVDLNWMIRRAEGV